MAKLFTLFFLMSFFNAVGQYGLSISEIQAAPEKLTERTSLLRMVEGAGFRYYWASEKLNADDYSYKPCDDCRTLHETIQHIYSLSSVIKYTILGSPVLRNEPIDNDNELIALTNKNWADAANYLRQNADVEVSKMQIDFGNGNPLPVWNLYNGPLADAIYHTGQIVTLRRASGNPINPKVNVLLGVLNP